MKKTITPNIETLVIIKTGESETFLDDSQQAISLGDVFRTSVLLRLEPYFQKILWLTSREALPLIKTSEKTSVDVVSNLHLYQQELNAKKSLILQLEKNDFSLNQSNLIGFVFEGGKWKLRDYLNHVYDLKEWQEKTRAQTWGEKILSLTGLSTAEKFGMLDRASINKKYDVGLNWQVGSKWKLKQLPVENWKQIEQALSDDYTISWQQGMNNLDEYIEWISSCRIIITTDSLGLHLAIALGIPVIAFFSVTSEKEIDHHGKVTFLHFNSSEEYDRALKIPMDSILKSAEEFLK